MTELGIDIETYSSVDLIRSGKYKYVESPDFEILLFAYKEDDLAIKIVDLANFETLPPHIFSALNDPSIIKTAYNAAFEKGCIDKYFSIDSSPWKCTMILSASLSYPLGLEACANALKIENKKDRTGKALIKLFSMPPRQYGPKEKWEAFKKYCIQDVEVETEIKEVLKNKVPDYPELYLLDQEINTNGVLIDEVLVNQAISIDAENRINLIAEAKEITNLENPNSVQQIIKWLRPQMPLTIVVNLTKKNIPFLIKETDNYENAVQLKRVLKIRQELSKSSIKKYQSMIDCRGSDGRARGLLQYIGAPRTGRWSGRLIQLQNLVKNNLKDLDLARNLIREGDSYMVDLLFGSISNTLSQLIRTALIPSPNNKFIITDFSAIEARVLAWIANEEWRLKVFSGNGRIYEESAVRMFKVPIESVTKESSIRFKAKTAELALGYGGSVGAMTRMGGEEMGLSEDEMQKIVDRWRNANPEIKYFWQAIHRRICSYIDKTFYTNPKYNGKGVITTNEDCKIKDFKITKFITIKKINENLHLILPSGRHLVYININFCKSKFGYAVPGIAYNGQNQVTGQWSVVQSYGGKFTENICQAIARDLLAEKLLQLKKYKIVFHVHDEIIIDCPKDTKLKDVNDIMCLPISWAPGLPLRADTTECNYYRKD